MYGTEKHVLLRHYLNEGMSKTAIARELGVDRRTIYRWIEAEELDRDRGHESVRYGPRAPKPTKLDFYKGILQARLKPYPRLTAIPSRGDPSGRVLWWLHAAQGVCAGGAA